MRAPIYKNQEFVRLFAAISVIVLVFLVLLAAGTYYAWDRARAAVTERNLGLLGSLLQAHPELSPQEAGRIIQAFTLTADPSALDAGRELAAKYGYTGELSLSSTPVLGRGAVWSLALCAGLGLLMMICLLGAVYSSGDKTYSRLSAYNLGADRIMRGDFSARFPESGEGELAMMGFQFNQLSRRLQNTFAALEDEKQQMKAMISGISHQLKTPLASSRVFVELLMEGAGDDPAILQEFLHKNLTQLERMEWLIQSLLKMSRLESGVIEFKRSNENLAETLGEVVTSLRDRAEDKSQTLSLPGSVQIMAPHDRKWLAEALHNLLDNAIRYTPEEGKIIVTLEQTDSTAVVRVSDTGPGIPAEELPRVFQCFYQGSTRGGGGQGSGIGLALAKLIIEKHGGVLEASSRVGRGSTFTVTLPRVWLS